LLRAANLIGTEPNKILVGAMLGLALNRLAVRDHRGSCKGVPYIGGGPLKAMTGLYWWGKKNVGGV